MVFFQKKWCKTHNFDANQKISGAFHNICESSLKTKFQKKYLSVTKLFNFENCVILTQIRFNLKLSNLDIFEIFDTADQS